MTESNKAKMAKAETYLGENVVLVGLIVPEREEGDGRVA